MVLVFAALLRGPSSDSLIWRHASARRSAETAQARADSAIERRVFLTETPSQAHQLDLCDLD